MNLKFSTRNILVMFHLLGRCHVQTLTLPRTFVRVLAQKFGIGVLQEDSRDSRPSFLRYIAAPNFSGFFMARRARMNGILGYIPVIHY